MHKLKPDTFVTHKCDAPSDSIELNKDELLKMFRQMVTIRRMETAADSLYKAKFIRGFCHLAIGQEAVPVGKLYFASRALCP